MNNPDGEDKVIPESPESDRSPKVRIIADGKEINPAPAPIVEDKLLPIENFISEETLYPKITETILEKPSPILEEADKTIETKKPKKPRTEKQKAVFEKARLKRAENIKKKKEEKEANKKPRGRPKKEVVESEEEEEIVYVKKPKAKKKPRKKKIVYISSSESEDEVIEYKKKPKKVDFESSSEEEEEYINYQETYKPPTSISEFYRIL